MGELVIQIDFNWEKASSEWRVANALVNLPYSQFTRYAASAASFLPFSTASSMVPTM